MLRNKASINLTGNSKGKASKEERRMGGTSDVIGPLGLEPMSVALSYHWLFKVPLLNKLIRQKDAHCRA